MCVYMYICMNMCIYVCMSTCKYVFMYICTYVHMLHICLVSRIDEIIGLFCKRAL